jgi:chemotaxis protein histidine kinase CheA
VFEAKQFVEGIAGTIKVESIEGKGTTFTLSLPI